MRRDGEDSKFTGSVGEITSGEDMKSEEEGERGG